MSEDSASSSQQNPHETCGHYDAQVGIRMVWYAPEERDEVDETCDWCNEEEVIGSVIKNERYILSLCEECRDIIEILVEDGDDDE